MTKKPASRHTGRYKQPSPVRAVTSYRSGIARPTGYGSSEPLRHALKPDTIPYVGLCGVQIFSVRFSSFQVGHPRSCKTCAKLIK